MKCIICKNSKHEIIWFDKLRSGKNIFTNNRYKIYRCSVCELVFLKKPIIDYENNNDLFRKKFDGQSSIKKYLEFHKPRELKKLKKILKYLNFDKKHILESNCGYGVILDLFMNKCKTTSGVDHLVYKNSLIERGHQYFSNINNIILTKKTFDIVLCLSELEHKKNPIVFLKKIKKIIKKNGKLIIRVPNFNNIYRYVIGYDFLKFDYRTSHNFYFSEKNLDILFRKINFKILNKMGYNEYSINHLFHYFRSKKRVTEIKSKKLFKNLENKRFIKNIEEQKVSTSLIYILKNG